LIIFALGGYLTDDPYDLQKYARLLLDERDLAIQIGRQVQETVLERFSTSRFKEAYLKSIEIVCQMWIAKKGQSVNNSLR
jgi:hypothetical protein